MNKAYAKGRAFEYRVRNHFKSMGFFVIRQAKSSFPDLVALKRGKVLLIECKVNGRLSSKERSELLTLSKNTGAEAFLASRDGRKLILESLPVSR